MAFDKGGSLQWTEPTLRKRPRSARRNVESRTKHSPRRRRRPSETGPLPTNVTTRSAPKSRAPSRPSAATSTPSSKAGSPPSAARNASPSSPPRLHDLQAQDAELGHTAAHEPHYAPTGAQLAGVADHLDQVIAEGDPAATKQLLRLLVAELRVHSRNRIQPTYRVIDPAVCATSGKWRRWESNPRPRPRLRQLLRA